MHVKVQSDGLVSVRVVAFRRKYQVWCKLRVTPKCTDTGDDVAEKGGVGMTGKLDGMMFERRTARKFFVNNRV